MKKQDFRDMYDGYVKPGILRWQQVSNTKNDDFAFLLWATDQVLAELDLTEEDVLNACRLDGRWDLKIDSAYIDKLERKMYLIQAKHFDPTKGIGNTPLMETWESLELLANPKLVQKSNKYTRSFYVEFCESIKQDYEVALCLATSGRILPPQIDYAEAKPKNRRIQVGDLWYEVPIKFQLFGLPELVEIDRQGESVLPGKWPQTVALNLEQGWYCVPANATGRDYHDSLYATVPAEELVVLRKNTGPDLYRLNYRGPLGDRIAVNRDILTTLTDMPNMFHVLNNGLAAICDHYDIDHDSQQVVVAGLQIVNGCQTVETLFHHADKVMGRTDVKVNLRLVACQPAEGGLVAKATNTQTKLRAEDFATLDPIQQDLQLEFRKLQPEGWYYEIKRGYWKNVISKDKSERQTFSDELDNVRVIRLRDAAQRSFAFLGEPIMAAQNTARIFVGKGQGGYKEDVFPSGLHSTQLLLPWMIYRVISEVIDDCLQEIDDLKERDSAREWMEYGRLTTLALVGDGLRNHYKAEHLNYLSYQLSSELVTKIADWVGPLAKHALSCIWNYAKSSEEWPTFGPRAVFRRHKTYETEVRPAFMASFHTSKAILTAGLP